MVMNRLHLLQMRLSRFLDPSRDESALREKLERTLYDTSRAARGLEHRLRCAARRRDTHTAERLLHDLLLAEHQKTTLKELGIDAGSEEIVLPTDVLRNSFLSSTQSPEEGLHFVLGFRRKGQRIGTRIEEFPLDNSVVHATGDHESTHRIVIDAQERGHALVGIFHSHPGNGPESTRPSGVDWANQETWEACYGIVSGIWSRDGYLRLFSMQDRHISVEGNDVTRIGKDVYQLADLDV